MPGRGIPRTGGRSRAGRLGRFFWRRDSIVPPLGCRGWRGSWRRRTCRSRNGRRTGNLQLGPVRPGSRRSRRTYQNSVSGDLISFLLQGKKKAEDILIHVPGLCLPAFFCCQIQMAQFFPDQPPDGGQQGVLFMGLTDHPAHGVCPLPHWDGTQDAPSFPLLGRCQRKRKVEPPLIRHGRHPATSAPQGAHTLWRSGIRRPG